VVRRRRHRRAIPQPDRRQDPPRSARADAGEKEGAADARADAPCPRHPRQRQADPRSRPHTEVSEKKYDKGVERFQGELARLTRSKRFDEESLVLVFEGADAAGKGGAIRRVTASLDARQYVTVPVAAPTEEERAHPYLWRFWRHVPAQGEIVIFDRSWYGRVLVERVEGYCTPSDWMRAYDEINRFEEQLTDAGAIVIKFWLQISKAEQLRRFREREKTAFKRFKITPDDWRNRKKWDAYEAGGGRHGRSHQHRDRAVDAGRGRRQVFCRASRSSRRSSSGSRRRSNEQ
jgi:polyphosphate kinase 2 (PPK2 family)